MLFDALFWFHNGTKTRHQTASQHLQRTNNDCLLPCFATMNCCQVRLAAVDAAVPKVKPLNVLLCVWQITDLYNESVNKIRGENDWPTVRPAFTCDLWRSRARREYFTLTMHWIHIQPAADGVSNCQWQLRNRILGSVAVHADRIDHEGEYMPHRNWALAVYCCMF